MTHVCTYVHTYPCNDSERRRMELKEQGKVHERVWGGKEREKC